MTGTRRQAAERLALALTRFSENRYMSAVRAGMVAVVPLTIIGGLFTIVSYLPVAGWDATVEPYRPLLQIPVSATFGVLALIACFSIAYDLGARLKQDPLSSASIATVAFLLIQVRPDGAAIGMDGLGSKGLFTAILVAIAAVHVQKLFTDHDLVVKMPASVPPVVFKSFLSLVPLCVLVVVLWMIRFVLGVDVDALVQAGFRPLVFALDTLPGILVYALVVTMLWSIGINGDNAMDVVVAPIFLQYLAANVDAVANAQPPPYATAYGFFTTFVNVGGTGATIALALVLWRSKEPGFRQVSRVSLPTQVFQINEPIFFGLPIVLNPVFMVPYVANALLLTAATHSLMQWGVIQRPFVNVPWTTPPIVGHYLVTGGDWRAAVWGAVSIVLAMAVYLPFAKAAERQRLRARDAADAKQKSDQT